MHKKREAEYLENIIKPACKNNPAIMASFKAVSRHLFVDEALQLSAYKDSALPIGYGQTISQPSLVAYMLHELECEKHHKCLEIGAGSAFVTALLSKLVAEVYAIEYIELLADRAKKILSSMYLNNVKLLCRDGTRGLPDFAPYDRILVSAGARMIPKPLLDQLVVGGIMVIPVNGMLKKVIKYDDEIGQIDLCAVSFVDFVNS